VEQADLLRHLIEVLEGLDVSYMLVGSVASGAYGEPRMTQDIDVVVALIPDDVPPLTRAFPSPEYYLSPEAARDAIRNGGQFNVIHSTSGNKIDMIIARRDAYGREQLSRRRRVWIFPDLEGYASSPEDVIVSKMAYYREGGSEKHLRDITGILKVSGEIVDRAYVARWAETLGLTEIWTAILRRLGAGEDKGGAA
jgi:predicted nucleotidyltransferase